MSEGGEEQDKDSKTEEPTQKKLEQALEKGQVVNSKDVTSFIMLLMLTMLTIWAIPYMLYSLSLMLRIFIEKAGVIPMDPAGIGIFFPRVMLKTLLYLSPLFIMVVLAAILSSYFQAGDFIFSWEPLQPQLSRLSIVSGFKRIFSKKSVVEFLKGLFKITLVGFFVLMVIMADVKELSQYQELSIIGILDQLSAMVKHVMILVTVIMAVIAAVDYAYQSYDHYTNLKMTKQEVKEEYKQSEGSPEVKQKQRELRRQRVQKQLSVTVPQAAVVITNPEHYAVALKYEANGMSAPICVAKGVDSIAQMIKSIARESEVPIIENPPLARALHKEVKLDQEIPVHHFEEVAKIISYVMSLNAEKKKNTNKR